MCTLDCTQTFTNSTMGRAQTRSKNPIVNDSMLPTPPSNTLEVRSPAESEAFQLPEPLLDSKDISPSIRHGVHPKRRNHSDIERRRRIKINGKYDELRLLVPSCAGFRFAKRGGDSGLHKLDILTEAVDYIKHLQSQLVHATGNNQPPPQSQLHLQERRVTQVTQPVQLVQTVPQSDHYRTNSSETHANPPNNSQTLIPSPQLIALASEAEKLAPLPVPPAQRSSIANLLN